MSEPSTAAPRELPRKLGLVTGMAVVVGVIIGSGIFRVPSGIAVDAGNLTGIALVWILGGAVALFGALSIAELAAMYPAAGGPYVYLREAYGRPLAFLFGWMWLLTTPISWAAQSLMFAEYLGFFVPIPVVWQHLIAAILILLVAAANYRSVKLGAVIQNVSGVAAVSVTTFDSIAGSDTDLDSRLKQKLASLGTSLPASSIEVQPVRIHPVTLAPLPAQLAFMSGDLPDTLMLSELVP